MNVRKILLATVCSFSSVGLALAGPTPPPARQIPLALLGQYLSQDSFGDSITFGFDASTAANNYVNLIGASLNLTATNHGVSGTMAADQAALMYGVYTPSATAYQLATYMIGTNDSNIYSNNAGQIANFLLFDQATIAYLALPNLLNGQNAAITYAGTWTSSSKYGGSFSKQSQTNGSTATFLLYGPVIYVAYTMCDGNAGSFTVTVDGTNAYSPNVYGIPTGTILTNNGGTCGSALLRIAGLSGNVHTVVATVSSATSGSNVVTLDWIASAVGNAYLGGSTVIVGGVPRQNTASSLPSYYTQFIQSNVALLAGDGLPVAYANVPGYIVPSTDLIGDNIHPNNLGMLHISQAFLSQIPLSSNPGAKQAGPTLAAGVPRCVAQIADGLVTGGSPRGQGACDGQTLRSNAAQVASGYYAGWGWGYNNAETGITSYAGGVTNVAAGNVAVALGDTNRSDGDRSWARGRQCNTFGRVGVDCWASGSVEGGTGASGDAQASHFILHNSTTGASAVRLTGDQLAASTANPPTTFGNCINMQAGQKATLTIDVTATDRTNPANSIFWNSWTGEIDRPTNAASTHVAMNSTPTPLSTGTVTGNGIAASADTTNSCLNLSVTPPSGNTDTWDFVAHVTTSEGM